MSGRTWAVLVAVIVALGAGFVIGQLVLGDDDDQERVVQVSPEPAATTGPGSTSTNPAATSLSVDDDGQEISDSEIQAIVNAATKAAGGGQVTDIERSDDPGEAFEVEVVIGNQEIDVALDESLRRVRNERFSD